MRVDYVFGVLDQIAVALLSGPKLLFSLFTFGDVYQNTAQFGGASVFPCDRHPILQPYHPAVGSHHPIFEAMRASRTSGFLTELHRPFAVFGKDMINPE
jgi:hypothetical protein